MAEIDMGVYHLTDNPRNYEPVRTNNFRFLVQGLDSLLRVGGDATNAEDYITNAQEVIEYTVVSFDAPHFTQDSIEVNRGNSRAYYAGKASFSQGSLVVNDFVGANSKSTLEAWQALSYDVVNDTIQRASAYKKDCIIMEYLPDNTLVRYWELKGCWVIGLSETGYDNNSSQMKTITATIKFDRAIPHLPD